MAKQLPKKRPIPCDTIVIGANEIANYKQLIAKNCSMHGQRTFQELLESDLTDFSRFMLAVVQQCERRASWDDVRNEMGLDYAVDLYGPRP